MTHEQTQRILATGRRMLLSAYVLALLGGAPASHWSVLACFCLFALCELGNGWAKAGRPILEAWLSTRVVVVAGVLMTGGWMLAVFSRHYALGYSNFDTGIYANLLSSVAQGGAYWSSLLQKPGLANHFTPALMSLSPLWWLWDSYLWLPLLKVLAFACNGYMLFQLGAAVLGAASRLRFVAPLLWFTNPFVAKSLEFEFQASFLALPLCTVIALCCLRRQFIRAVILLIVVALLRENLALFWISAGALLALIQGERVRGLALAVSGVAVGVVIYFFVMPRFDPAGALSHSFRFDPWALPGKKLKLIVDGVLSLGLLPLLAPQLLLIVLPAYGLNLLANDPQMLSYSFHYQDLPLGVLFIALPFALRALPVAPRYLQSFGVLVGILLLGLSHRTPMQEIWRNWGAGYRVQTVQVLSELAARLPRDQDVWAPNSVGPLLASHPRLRALNVATLPSSGIFIYVEGVPPWPLSTVEYQRLGEALMAQAERGELSRAVHGGLVSVYHSARLPFAVPH